MWNLIICLIKMSSIQIMISFFHLTYSLDAIKTLGGNSIANKNSKINQ